MWDRCRIKLSAALAGLVGILESTFLHLAHFTLFFKNSCFCIGLDRAFVLFFVNCDKLVNTVQKAGCIQFRVLKTAVGMD